MPILSLVPSSSDPEIIDAASRREFLTMLTAAGLLAACGGEGYSTDAVPDAVTGFPRTVEFEGGRVEVPRPPQRIYTTGGAFALDNLLALGVLPVIYSPFNETGPQPWQRAAGLLDVPTTELEPNVEAFAEVAVDFAMLRFEGEYNSRVGERIRALCPTVHQPEPPSTPALLRLWGEILGLEERAAELLTEFEATLAALRIADAPMTAVVVPAESGAYVYQQGLPLTDDVLAGAGVPVFQLPPDVARDGTGVELSSENLGLLEPAEVIVAIQPYGPTPAVQALEDQPLFQRLPAVRAGRYRLLDEPDSTVLLAPTALSAGLIQDVLDRIYA